jgi:carbonic anhydrase/acetyltransferase-like protein (isoleucine patch superfamily)
MLRSYNGHRPKVHPTAFVHEAAQVIGAVTIGPKASIWPGAVLRGDVNRIVVGANSNIQDNCVIHVRHQEPCVVGKGVTVGHGVILHGAKVRDGCLIGMGSVVMEADIGRQTLVAAGSVVLAGLKVPQRSVVMGSPARIKGKLKPRDAARLAEGEREYLKLSRLHKETSRPLA